jgi:endonuclease/exonuclease/phosphatase family metal-dependent hydrolase
MDLNRRQSPRSSLEAGAAAMKPGFAAVLLSLLLVPLLLATPASAASADSKDSSVASIGKAEKQAPLSIQSQAKLNPRDGIHIPSGNANVYPTFDAQPNRVGTMNLWNPGGRAVDAAADVLARYKPQVVGLQEACSKDVIKLRDKLRERTGINYHAITANFLPFYDTKHVGRCWDASGDGGFYGIGMLTASPITASGSHSYEKGGTENRGYLWANTLVDGVEVRVFNTHLAQAGQASERRSEVAELVGEAARHDRSLVVGDFNAEPQNDELKGMWTAFREADLGCGPAYSATCAVTANAYPRRKKFDYVWINDAFQFGPGVITVDTWSDHDFVFSDVVNTLF